MPARGQEELKTELESAKDNHSAKDMENKQAHSDKKPLPKKKLHSNYPQLKEKAGSRSVSSVPASTDQPSVERATTDDIELVVGPSNLGSVNDEDAREQERSAPGQQPQNKVSRSKVHGSSLEMGAGRWQPSVAAGSNRRSSERFRAAVLQGDTDSEDEMPAGAAQASSSVTSAKPNPMKPSMPQQAVTGSVNNESSKSTMSL
eukprot:gnl/MRDRNA2_/MRDRNA2_53877_c0_seq1.p1 gnl/MRDRNA2_/MRDRNA2_53877_c0~~gnl/MRDRNA2_/MRDRNA2_53877_c0_seq1.p1  ORF type:complete len:222 (-),score=49.57 gnl/MRDRNA2_/MRDRNA2_53877_c0_seq1:77-685(-)